MHLRLPLIYADRALLVVDKPAGMLAVPGRGPDKQDCMSARVQAHISDALIVHRLDMDTSGLLCFARGNASQRNLSLAFAERRVHKRYIAEVHGRLGMPGADWAAIDLPLMVDWPNRPRSKVDHQNGKPSLTRWRALAYDAVQDLTRVELEPVSGRSHQLRVHLSALGHAIVGDPLYGVSPTVAGTRMRLHACHLRLPHPDGLSAAVCCDSLPDF